MTPTKLTSPSSNPGTHSIEYVTLRDYIDKCFELHDTSQRERDVARDRAIDTAYENLNRRQDASNEIRESLRDVSNNAVTINAFDAFKQRLEDDLKYIRDDIRVLRESKAEEAGKATQESVNKVSDKAILGLLIGGGGLFFAVLSLILRFFGL